MKLLLRLVINMAAIWVTSLVLSGLSFTGNVGSLILVGVIFGLVNALIRPIVRLLTLPLTIVTLGLFTLVINAIMLMITVLLSDSLDLTGNIFENFIAAAGGVRLSSTDLLDLSTSVKPGESYSVVVPMKAPSSAGQYGETWSINESSANFCQFYNLIDVSQ